jgi:hypothetical protein
MRAKFGLALQIIGNVVTGLAFFAYLIVGVATMPHCGPWLNGIQYNECMEKGRETGAIFLLLLIIIIVTSQMVAWSGRKMRGPTKVRCLK